MTLIYARVGGEPNEEWLRARRGKITASEMHRLMGSARVRATYLIEKLTERLTDLTVGRGVTAEMQHGIDTEQEAAEDYELRTGNVCVPGYWIERDGWGATPDFLVGDDGGVEIKCPQAKTTIRERFEHLFLPTKSGEPEIRADYWWQCQACLAITGRKWWDLTLYTTEFWQARDLIAWDRRIEPDHEAIESMLVRIAEANAQLDEAVAEITGSYRWVDDVLAAIREARSHEELQAALSAVPAVAVPGHISDAIDAAAASKLDTITFGG